jgi:hypothetical protein
MVAENKADPSLHNSHLFTLRMWPEDLGSGQTDWRGKVQHVNSREARYFRDWPTLEAFVEGLLRESDPERVDTRTAEGREVETLSQGDAETQWPETAN